MTVSPTAAGRPTPSRAGGCCISPAASNARRCGALALTMIRGDQGQYVEVQSIFTVVAVAVGSLWCACRREGPNMALV